MSSLSEWLVEREVVGGLGDQRWMGKGSTHRRIEEAMSELRCHCGKVATHIVLATNQVYCDEHSVPYTGMSIHPSLDFTARPLVSQLDRIEAKLDAVGAYLAWDHQWPEVFTLLVKGDKRWDEIWRQFLPASSSSPSKQQSQAEGSSTTSSDTEKEAG